MGGRFDSSRTRVAPVFSALSARQDPWLPTLLRLPKGGARSASVIDPGALVELAFGDGMRREKRLPAPPSLLRLLVRQVHRRHPQPNASHATLAKRDRLFERDPEVMREALELIDQGRVSRGWHVFEGPTAPDVYIATTQALIVIEGKRTEAGATIDTQWMKGRHQMWRHIDAAWEVKGARRVYGLFIVEGDEQGRVPSHWHLASQATCAEAALASSFPHRTPSEREEVRRCFLGVTTWQTVVKEFALPATVLLDTVPRKKTFKDGEPDGRTSIRQTRTKKPS